MMAYPSRDGQSRGVEAELAETPEQPEGDASRQDMDLEAQLDDLLARLEEVDPQTVPDDLRKHKPAEPVVAEPVVAEPVAAEGGVGPEAEVEPVAAEAEPVAEAEVQAEAEPVTVEAEVQAEAKPETETESIPEAASTPQAEAEPVIADAGGAEAVVEEAVAAVEESVESAEPAVAGLDLDAIASMASELLNSQIDATIDAKPTASGAEPSSPEETPAEVEGAGAPEVVEAQAADPPAFKALSEDDLMSQIAGLLGEVQNPGVVVGEPQASSPDETKESVAGGAESAASVEAGEAVTEAASAEAAEEAGAVSIDQIDAMLAESAEQAIEHGPDPEADVPPGTDEVLAAQAKAEEEAEARAQADRDSAEAEAVAVAVTEPEAVSEPESVAVSSPVPEAEPEPVAVEPMPVPAGASAGDVASELDEDTQAVAAESLIEDVSEAGDEAGRVPGGESGGASGSEEVVIELGGLKKAEHALLLICGKINRPLNGLSEEMRNTVGYAGVVTTLLALFMLLYGVLF